MTEGQRTVKRLIIIGFYLLIAALVASACYFLFRSERTCSDGKRNQGEEGIDCGGPCAKCEPIPNIENVEVLEKKLIPAGPGKQDALIKIKNPNASFGVANLDYSVNILDSNGIIMEKRDGTTFILPAQTKYVLEFNFVSGESANSFSFNIKSFRWQKFSEYIEPDISVYGKEFNLPQDGNSMTQLKAKIQNRSNYDFKKISTKVVLRDMNGLPIAVNQTDNNDVRANEEREVIFNWNAALPGNVDPKNIEIEPDVDAFSNDNFMKQYGSPEQYQSYGTGDNR